MVSDRSTRLPGGTPSAPDRADGEGDVARHLVGELQCVEPGIDAVLPQQLAMRSGFGDAAGIDDMDDVGVDDGGEAMRASGGIVAAARLARAPVVPITYATARRRILASWDRFHLPFPWTRGIYLWGEPIEIPAELDAEGSERWRRLIEERMVAQTAEADRPVGCEATAPGTLGRDDLRALRRAAPGGGR